MDVLEYFKEEMVRFSNEQDKEKLLSEMAEQLCEVGAVKPSYKDAVIKREKVFPTGLLTAHAGLPFRIQIANMLFGQWWLYEYSRSPFHLLKWPLITKQSMSELSL